MYRSDEEWREVILSRVRITENGCWEWSGYRGKDGYCRLKYHGRMMSGHRVAWIVFVGPIPNDKWVLHNCDNRPCLNPFEPERHLYLGTHQDNTRDALVRGRYATGERSGAFLHPDCFRPRFGESHPVAKLTTEQVRYIASMRGIRTNADLAAEFSISTSRISDIWHNRAWREILCPVS